MTLYHPRGVIAATTTTTTTRTVCALAPWWVRRAADLGLSGDCRRPCTRALFGAETLEIEMEMEMEIELEMEMEIFGIFGEGYFISLLNGADLGEGAKLGEALLNNGPQRPRGCRPRTARKGQGACLAVVHPNTRRPRPRRGADYARAHDTHGHDAHGHDTHDYHHD